MNAKRLFAMTAAAVLCLGIGQANAADPTALNAMHPAVGERAAGHWTAEARSAAKIQVLPEIDLAAVRAAVGPQEGAAMPEQMTQGSGDGLGGTGGGGGSGGDGGLGGGGGGGGGGIVKGLPMWGGTFYYTKPEGDYICTAQFVSKNVILTAAFCVQDSETGAYHKNLHFVQKDAKGKENAYDVECAATFDGWSSKGDDKWIYDMSMVLVKGKSKVGWMGFVWDWKSIGPFGFVGPDGYVVASSGSVSAKNGSAQMKASGVDKLIGGEAWMTATKDDQNKLQHAFGLYAFVRKNQPGSIFGPYFDDKIKKLYDYTQNGCQ